MSPGSAFAARALGLWGAVIAASLAPGGAAAQSFSGMGPTRPFVLPSAAPEPGPDRPAQPATAEPERRPAPMRHLPSHPNGFRLGGEAAMREWPLAVSEAEARAGGTFRIAYTAAVSILPEASVLRLAVNDKIVGSAAIKAGGGQRSVTFDIPPGQLAHGANAIRITADQRHRVDCSPAATYELWTQLDPDGTGFVPAAGARSDVTGAAGLATLPLDGRGSVSLRAVQADPKMVPRDVERTIAALQAVTLLGRFEQPRVDFGPPAEDGSGLNVAVGTQAALAKAFELAPLGRIDGPRVALLPETASRRPSLLVTGATEAHVDAALAGLATSVKAPPFGSEAGLRVLADHSGRRIAGGERLTLRDLGFVSSEFAGRSFRLPFNLVAPHDFLSADYGKMILNLAGGYSEGLTAGAQIAVEVNGVTVASLTLGRKGGDVFRNKQVFLPLSSLQPGLNRIAISAQLPAAADEACEAEGSSPKSRFFLLDTTELTIPPLALIARSPMLTHLGIAASPLAQAARRPRLHVPAPDRATMAAAATFAARLAVAAGAPLDFEFVTAPPRGRGSVLTISPAPNLAAADLATSGLDPEMIRAAWSARLAEGRGDGGVGQPAGPRRRRPGDGDRIAACRPTREPLRPVPALAAPVAEAAPDRHDRPAPAAETLFSKWSLRLGANWPASLNGIAAGVARRVEDAALAVGIASRAQPENGGVPAMLGRATLVVSQGRTGPEPDDVLTIVTATDGRALADGVACLSDPRVWSQLGGQVSMLDGGVGRIERIEPNHTEFVETQPRSLGNLRRILAGWLSLFPMSYALAGMLLAGCLAGSTHWLVGNVGRRQS